MYNVVIFGKCGDAMNFDAIKFPVAGIAQKQIHFTDEIHNYAFSFASPYIYNEPRRYKEKNAFLLGAYNPFNPELQVPEKIYSYFTVSDKKEPYRDKKLNLNCSKVQIFDESDQEIGHMDVLFPRNRFFKFSVMFPNILYNASGEPVAFCHYQPALRRKCIYSFQSSFDGLYKEIKQEAIRDLENQGIIRCHFTYDLVRRDSDARKMLETIFSSEKKSELIQNRINMIQKPNSDEAALFYLTAMVAFFWNTMIELPLTEN